MKIYKVAELFAKKLAGLMDSMSPEDAMMILNLSEDSLNPRSIERAFKAKVNHNKFNDSLDENKMNLFSKAKDVLLEQFEENWFSEGEDGSAAWFVAPDEYEYSEEDLKEFEEE